MFYKVKTTSFWIFLPITTYANSVPLHKTPLLIILSVLIEEKLTQLR